MVDIAINYVQALKALGIDAQARLVDPAQYQNRIEHFDFDIVVQRYSMRLSPGVELRTYFGCEAARTDGSNNLAGICDPVVDGLIEKIVKAQTRAELLTACHALDRVLRAQFYWVPHWYKASHAIAYWDKFARPETAPKYQRGILDTWWVDPAKEAAIRR
jgi:microcin C transport system substrate-binding protein